MKKYLKKELASAKEALFRADTIDKSQAAIRAVNELYLLQTDYQEKTRRLETSKLINLGGVTISDELFAFIKAIIQIYAEMPLLETESTMEYPVLCSTKKLGHNQLRNFYNSLYDKEYGESNFSEDNTKIVEPSLYRSLTFASGTCYVYHSLQGPKMVIEREHSIRDLVVPSREGIMMIDEFSNQPYNSLMDVAKYYMEYQALKKLEDTSLSTEAKKYSAITIDNQILLARMYKRKLDEGTDLSQVDIAKLINYINQVIGYNLARHNHASLSSLTTPTYLTSEGTINLPEMNSSYQEIIDDTLELSKSKVKVKL